jgi:predicted transcriptional regulator of viral defense system
MASLDQYLDAQLVRGRPFFTREEALAELRLSPLALKAAVGRMARKQRVANLRHGFYLILRPEDRVAGAPDPARWIDPLMKYQGVDYRVSLLRAAAFHGSSHQAAMTFQVIVPKQLRDFEIGRHRLQFVYQAPAAFAQVNKPQWLGSMKSDAGFAQVASIELTLLDCARYYHKSAGINGLAQIVKDIGEQADARKLAEAAEVYENASVRRLGYLLDQAGCASQASALEPFVKMAKTSLLLDPSIKPLISAHFEESPRIAKWKLVINEPVEADF